MEIDRRFSRIKGGEEDLIGDLEEEEVGPREFTISQGRMMHPRELGKAYRFPQYEYDITVQYPSDEDWGRAAHSDIQLIRYKLLNTPTSVSGVQGRWFKPDMGVELQKSMDGYFQFFVMPLFVEYSTDDTA